MERVQAPALPGSLRRSRKPRPTLGEATRSQCWAGSSHRLSEEYESAFSTHCRDFRPNRSCQTEINKTLEIANQGYVWVVDLDLLKFFDAVNHSKLLQLLSDKLGDG